MPTATRWYVYLLRCGDGTLYAGATTDVESRLAAHREGRGARYTRGRAPLSLVLCEPQMDRSSALRRECALKRLRRRDKLALLARAGMKVSMQVAAVRGSRSARRRARGRQSGERSWIA